MTDFTGTSGNDVLVGTSGDDRLDGGAGADLLIGGDGDDTYFLDDNGDMIAEDVGKGFDIAYAALNYALAAGAEVEVLSVNDLNATIAINLTGNDYR